MAGLEIGRTGEGSNSQWFMGNFSALCFPAPVTVRFWQSCSGGPMTSLPVLGADGVHLGSGLRAHPLLWWAVLNIQHKPSLPLYSSVKQLFISETIDLDIILQKRDEHLRSFTICCTSAEFSAWARNAVRRLLHHVWCRCPSWHVFFLNNIMLTSLQGMLSFCLNSIQSLCLHQYFLGFCHLKCLLMRSNSFISQLLDKELWERNKGEKKRQTNGTMGRSDILIERSWLSTPFVFLFTRM